MSANNRYHTYFKKFKKLLKNGHSRVCAKMTSSANINDKSRPRLNLTLGAIIMSVLILGVLALVTFLAIRLNHYDPFPWFYIGGPTAVLFVSFVVRLYRWCGWRHLCLCLPISLGIALFGFSRLFHMGFDAPGMYIALAVLAVMILAPGLLGTGVGYWASLRANTARRRAAVILVAVAVVAAVPAIRWLGWRVYAWYTASHAEAAGKPHLRAHARDLRQTEVAPTLDTPISEGRNLIWCATSQIAWNELCALAGEDVRMEREDRAVALLNQKTVTRDDLDESTYFATAGTMGAGVRDAIQDGLRTSFQGQASPELIPSEGTLPADAVVAYAYLFANLPFEWAFDRLDYPIRFGDAEVKAFGITQYLKSQEKERLAASQLLIYDPRGEHDVIIELKTRLAGHRLVLAKVPPLETIGETAKAVLKRIEESEPQSLPEWENFAIPIVDFDLTREYEELVGRPLRVSHSSLSGVPIVQATQQIRFKLDERGAVLKSEAVIATLGMAASLTFDRPFLILLKYSESSEPYFAAWIDNPELLVRE